MEEDIAQVDTDKGASILANFLDQMITLMVNNEEKLKRSSNSRISDIHPLYASILEDCISIRLLGEDSRLNQCYIISRALLERLINYCYLQVCSQEEFDDFISYSKNKAARRLSRSIESGGETKAKVEFAGGQYTLSKEMEEAVQQFTSQKGKEITRWTKLSLPDRATVVEQKAEKTSLFMHLLIIYSDASEALHGTIYGSLFHLGAYDLGSIPSDQASLDKHRYSTLSALYLFSGSAIDTMFSFMYQTGNKELAETASASNNEFKTASIKSGLLKVKKKSNN